MKNPKYSYPAGSMRSVEGGFYPAMGPTMRDVWAWTSPLTESFGDWYDNQWSPLSVEDKEELKALATKVWWDRFMRRS